jgi:malonate transporter and related proteins
MISILTIIIPVFSLIAVGYGIVKTGYFAETSQKGLSDFAFLLAVPAMLFRTIVTAESAGDAPWKILGAYFGTVLAVWAMSMLLTHVVLRRPGADAASIGMTSTYGNLVMLGIPLALAIFGPAVAPTMAVILMVNTPVMWLVATLHMQAAEHAGDGRTAGRLVRELGLDLMRNPLIIAMLMGSLWRFTSLGLTPALDAMLATLGQAGTPCALVALGGSLTRFQIKGQAPTLATIIVLKLLVMPSVAWVLAFWVFALSPLAASLVVLFAALPAGANAYLFATQYNRTVNSTSGAVALGTVLSAGTVALLIAALGY